MNVIIGIPMLLLLRLDLVSSQLGCNNHQCGSFSICIPNGNNDYSCRCQPGYTSPYGRNCQPIPEIEYLKDSVCAEANCGDNTQCIEVGGEAICECKLGYYRRFSNDKNCIDKNECALMPCGTYSQCINIAGGYYCRCLQNFKSDTKNGVNCGPIQANYHCNFANSCGSNSRCARTSNHGNNHRCSCMMGYYVSNGRNCPDRDECTALPNGACGENAQCMNTIGSYRCECDEGFEMDSSMRCVDIDECEENICGANSACLNSYGSYKCECLEGYMSKRRDNSRCVEDPDFEHQEQEGGDEEGGVLGFTGMTQRQSINAVLVVAGIILALLLLIALIAILYFIIKKRKRSQRRKFAQGLKKPKDDKVQLKTVANI